MSDELYGVWQTHADGSGKWVHGDTGGPWFGALAVAQDHAQKLPAYYPASKFEVRPKEAAKEPEPKKIKWREWL